MGCPNRGRGSVGPKRPGTTLNRDRYGCGGKRGSK